MNKIRNEFSTAVQVHVHSAFAFHCMRKLHYQSYGYFSTLTIVAVDTNAANCALFEKLMVPQLVKKFPPSYETRIFITAFIKAHHFSHMNPVYSQPISSRPILILSYHLRQGLPSGHFPSCFLTENLNEFLISPTRATGPIHLFLLDLITCITFGVEYKS
jgi:hypothetical protein